MVLQGRQRPPVKADLAIYSPVSDVSVWCLSCQAINGILILVRFGTVFANPVTYLEKLGYNENDTKIVMIIMKPIQTVKRY